MITAIIPIVHTQPGISCFPFGVVCVGGVFRGVLEFLLIELRMSRLLEGGGDGVRVGVEIGRPPPRLGVLWPSARNMS